MKIVKVKKEQPVKIEIDYKRVNPLVIVRSKKKLTATQKKYNTLTKRYLKEIEEQINMNSKNLYINDEFMAKKIGTTYSVAKKIKKNLQDAELLILVEKQKGQGKYPLWFFNFDFVQWIETPVKKRNRRSREELYEQELLDLYAEAELRILDKFAEMENDIKQEVMEFDGVFQEIEITNIQYYIMVEQYVSSVLKGMNLERADFKI